MRRNILESGNHRGARIAAVLCGLALLAALPVAAANWKSVGPTGGFIPILQAPSEPGRLYAGTPSAGGFGSLDNGRTWRPLPGLSSLAPPILAAVAVAPDDADTVFFFSHSTAGTQLLRSRDGGAHFERLQNGLTPAATRFATLAIAPFLASHLVLGTTDGVFLSDDQGDRWHRVAFPGQEVQELAFDPNGPGNLIAVVNVRPHAPSIWLSRDGGLTWKVTGRPDADFPFLRPVFDPVQVGTLYLVAGSRLFRSTDLSASWTEVPTGRTDITDITVLSDGTLLASSFSGIYRSTDGGAGWSLTGPEPAAIRPAQNVFLVDAALDDTTVGAFALGSSGSWRTDDGGETWVEASRGIRAHIVNSLAAGAAIYTVLDGSGVYRRLPGAGSWVKTQPGTTLPLPFLDFPAYYLRLLAVDPQDPDNVLADLASRLVQSRDGGATWPTRLPAVADQFGFNAFAAAFAPSDPNQVYVAGATTSAANGFENTLWRSRNRGTTWAKVSAFGGIQALAIDPRNPERLFAAAKGVFATSVNGGRHWRKIGRGLPGAGHVIHSILIDPGDPQHLYFAIRPGVWESRDGGTTFQPLGSNLGTDV
ncbi:MAG TPA: hypothetical protein VN851_11090, partial [Thermoanaerobaculia bacterium]|nr:hypothetical protein [Thermoanaerobaculia bacterium]